jgi:glycosyltransferase involved in cell wall biosynthesis
MKKLSIVTINYNNISGLKVTLESICKKSLPKELVEFILIDGGSNDGSVELIKDYETYINEWVSEKDSGIFHAMNKGLARATGEYIIFMNSGDSFIPDVLNPSFIRQLQGPDIYYGDIILQVGAKMTPIQQTPTLDFIYMLGKTICHQSVFMKTTLCKKYSFTEDKQYSLMGDWIQLFYMLKLEKLTVSYLQQAVCIYNGEGQSEKFETLRHLQRKQFLEQFYSSWELEQLMQLHRLRSRRYYSLVMQSLDRYYLSKIMNFIANLVR